MKKTPLYNSHVEAGAKIIDFSGWQMPVQYNSIIQEHNNTRNNVTLFDTCHMGEFYVKGEDAFKFLQNVLPADFEKVNIGQAKYTFLLNENAGTIDDLIVFHIDDNQYMICVNAGTIDKDFNALSKHAEKYSIKLTNKSDETAKIDVQGPLAEKVITKFIKDTLPKRFRFIQTEFLGKQIILSRTGYTGEDGFELFLNAEDAEKTWKALLEKGREFNISPAGLGARDSLRLEAGYPLYGHELSDDITPLEAGLSFAVDLNKDFYGKKALIDKKDKGFDKKLVAVEMLEKGIPREGYKVFDEKGKHEIGIITSGTFSPTFKKGLALAYVKTGNSDINTKLKIKIRNNLFKAVIKKRPIYPFKGGK